MTDDVGILQFSKLSAPDPQSGYTLDDNARALIVSLYIDDISKYALNYASYLRDSQQIDGTWSNFLLDNEYYSHFDSEDSFGRALLASSLGANSETKEVANICKKLFAENMAKTAHFNSPRGIAYALLALCKAEANNLKLAAVDSLISLLSERLVAFYQRNHQKKWLWFEENLTYCNGILPQAMFNVYAVNGDKKCLQIAHETLNFLCDVLFRDGYLNIVGNNGWYSRNGTIPLFDQQPVDAVSIIYSCIDAYETIGEMDYLQLAVNAYKWYHGNNIHGLPLYNPNTGGCFDGLTAQGVNLNQGAEAILSLLFSDILIKNFIEEKVDIDKSS